MTKVLKLITIPLILITLLLGGCGSTGSTSSNLKVSDVREIKVENGRIHSLSPDGKYILSVDNEKMYFYDTESMDEEADVSVEDINGIDLSSIQWSPNSKYVVFTQDFYRMMIEPDIYVVDVEKGKLDNITDDRQEKFSLTEENKKVKLDMFPMWLKDSKNIIFTRIELDGRNRDTLLYQIDMNGDKEKEISDGSIAEGMTVVSLNPASSVKKTYFTVMAPKRDDRHNGIWIMENGEADQTDYKTGKDAVPSVLSEVTANGEYGLVYYLDPSFTSGLSSYFGVVRLKDGEVTPIIKESDKNDKEGPYNAVFSPDGKKVLYTYRDAKQEKYLAVKDINGDGQTELWSKNDLPILGKNGIFSPAGLYWAKNNTILICTMENTGYLIELR